MARILRFRDSAVPNISGTGTDTVHSSTPQCGPEEPVSVPVCCTSTFYYINGSERPVYGSRLRTRLTGRDFRDQGCVYAVIPPVEPADQPVIQGTFLLSRLWARILFG